MAGKPQLNFHCLVASQPLPESKKPAVIVIKPSFHKFSCHFLNYFCSCKFNISVNFKKPAFLFQLMSRSPKIICHCDHHHHLVTPLSPHSESHSKVSEFSTNSILPPKSVNLRTKYQIPGYVQSLVFALLTVW